MHKLHARDIYKFGRALRIHDYADCGKTGLMTPSHRQGARSDDTKPWAWSEVSNSVDVLLFNAFTTINIGNGKKTLFWHCSWLGGEAPKNLALHVLELAKRKEKKLMEQGR